MNFAGTVREACNKIKENLMAQILAGKDIVSYNDPHEELIFLSDFMNFVLSYLTQILVLLIPVVLLCLCGLLGAAKLYNKKHGGTRKFPWGRVLLTLALIGYLAVVCYVTLVRSGHMGTRYANWHLFRAWREAWNSFSERQWMNVLLNIAMFMPLGVLLPLLGKSFRKWYLMLPAGFGTSLAIELVQYLSGRGICDVDDLFCNTLGAMLGFWLVMLALQLGQRHWKQGLCHTLALTCAAASIGSVFIAYEIQEFGNLTTSPAFRVNTRDVEWNVNCELSETTRMVDLYRTRTWNREECETFGLEFFRNIGVEEVDVTIYNDEVYLRERMGSRWLEVFYQGGHYSFTDREDWDILDETYDPVEEQILREALLDYGIEIPETAEFTRSEGNIYSFRADRCMDGDTMIDGAVSVRWEEGYGIREIDNDMLRLTYYGEAEIISPKAAAQRLMDGHINSGEWFERKQPKRIEIQSCELSYQVDTKGFYQPVYLIELESTDTDYGIIETVPAIK